MDRETKSYAGLRHEKLVDLSETVDGHGGRNYIEDIRRRESKQCGGAKSMDYYENTQEPEIDGQSPSG